MYLAGEVRVFRFCTIDKLLNFSDTLSGCTFGVCMEKHPLTEVDSRKANWKHLLAICDAFYFRIGAFCNLTPEILLFDRMVKWCRKYSFGFFVFRFSFVGGGGGSDGLEGQSTVLLLVFIWLPFCLLLPAFTTIDFLIWI